MLTLSTLSTIHFAWGLVLDSGFTAHYSEYPGFLWRRPLIYRGHRTCAPTPSSSIFTYSDHPSEITVAASISQHRFASLARLIGAGSRLLTAKLCQRTTSSTRPRTTSVSYPATQLKTQGVWLFTGLHFSTVASFHNPARDSECVELLAGFTPGSFGSSLRFCWCGLRWFRSLVAGWWCGLDTTGFHHSWLGFVVGLARELASKMRSVFLNPACYAACHSPCLRKPYCLIGTPIRTVACSKPPS